MSLQTQSCPGLARTLIWVSLAVLLTGCSQTDPLLNSATPKSCAVPVPSQTVGTLQGEFAVNGNGSSTYQVPITVPPGTAQVQPALKVSYDSHRGDGYLGMGWTLDGISAISRCPASYQVDGFKSGVNFSSSDRFCLDGRRLIVVNGKYGKDGAVYHTESETWTQVVSHGSCGAGPCSFSATDKDGNTLSFGTTTGATGSRVLASNRTDGAVRVWAIDRWTDLHGNYVAVDYTNVATTGEYYPKTISYTGHQGQSTVAPQRSVQFVYEDRAVPKMGYIAGSVVTTSKLLKQIGTYVGSEAVMSYNFGYLPSNSTMRPLLQTITWCDAQGACLPATSMKWTKAAGTYDSTGQLPGPLYVLVNNSLYVQGVLQDVNSDGIADYSNATEFIGAHGNSVDLKVYLGRADGTFVDGGFSLPGPVWRATSAEVVKTGLLVDFNGDGVLDFSAATRNEDAQTEDYTIWLGNKTGYVKQPDYKLPDRVYWVVNGKTLTTGIVQDLNGDGLIDYSRATKNLDDASEVLEIYKGTGSGFSATGVNLPGPRYTISGQVSQEAGLIQDLNGDGIADYSAATVNEDSGQQDLGVYLGATPDFSYTRSFDLPGQVYWVVNGRTLTSGVLVDLNGDAIADYSRATLLVRTGSELLDVHLGTGSGYTPSAFELPGPVYLIDHNASAIQGMISDIDGDGIADYSRATTNKKVQPPVENLKVYRGTTTGFVDTGVLLPGPLFTYADIGTIGTGIFQDINGDGLRDYAQSLCVERNGSTNQCELGISLARGDNPDLLERITNGLGGSTAVTYAPLTSDLYDPSATSTYPYRVVQNAMQVVVTYVVNDGRGNEYNYNYQYANGKTDVLGRGWLGFEQVTMIEAAAGRQSVVTYDVDYPRIGQVKSSAVTDLSGTLLTHTVFTYVDGASAANQALGIHQYLKASETFTHYTDGATDYSLEQQYQYDAYGNLELASHLGDVTTTDDDLYTCTRYSNNAHAGRLGYILQQKSTRTREACQSFVNAADGSTITWNPDTDLRWNQRTYDDSMDVRTRSQWDDSQSAFVTSSWTYDQFGNISGQTDPAGNETTMQMEETYHTFPSMTKSPTLKNAQGDNYRLTNQFQFDPCLGTQLVSTDPNGNQTWLESDGFGRIVNHYATSPGGSKTLTNRTSWQHDANGNFLLGQSRPTWDATDPDNWYYNKTYVDGMHRTYRTAQSGLKSGTPTAILTATNFDAAGRVHQRSAPYFEGDAAPYTTTTYDEYNRPVLVVDPSGVKTKTTFSLGGWKVSRTFAFGTPDARTEVQYMNAQGKVRSRVSPNGQTTNYDYDRVGLLKQLSTTPEQRLLTRTYDSLGRVQTEESGVTGITTWQYDPAGRLFRVEDAAGNTLEFSDFDAMNRTGTQTQTAGSQVSTYVYHYDDSSVTNGLGNLTRVDQTQSGFGSWSSSYAYDAFSRTIAGTVEINSNSYSFGVEYDPRGGTSAYTYPDGTRQTISYGIDQQLATLSLQSPGDNAATPYVKYSNYNALGQSQNASFVPNGVSVSWSYFPPDQAIGKLKSINAVSTKQSGAKLISREYSWNSVNLVTAIKDNLDGNDSQAFGYKDQPSNIDMGFLTSATGAYGATTYQYDNLGNVTQKDGVTFDYSRDRLTGDSDGASYQFYNNGNLKEKSKDGITWTYQYNAAGALVSIEQRGAAGTVSASAAYDYQGRRIFEKKLGSDVATYFVTDNFEVTDLGNGGTQHTKYVMGQTGEAVAITTVASTSAMTAPIARNHHQLVAGVGVGTGLIGGASLVGSLVSSLVYHPFVFSGQIVSAATLAAGILVAFGLLIATFKRRQRKVRLQQRVASLLVPLACAAMITPFPGTAFANLTPGANGSGIPVVSTQFFVQDLLGSTVSVTDGAGVETANVSYRPYGAIDQPGSSGTDDFRPKFGGKSLDEAAGLYDFGHRQLDPDLGRFTTIDPAQQFVSPYLYAGSSPASGIDPSGNFALLAAIIIGAIVGAYFGAAAVNHDFNPTHWDWGSNKTYAGLLGGALIGGVGAAAGGIFVEAGVAVGSAGGTVASVAGAAIGISGDALVGAAENAAFTAMGGGSDKEIADAAVTGAVMGGLFSAAGKALGSVASRFARNSEAFAEEAGEGGSAIGRGARNSVEEDAEVTASACARSFPAGTVVLGGDGQQRAIETVEVGETLMAFHRGEGVAPARVLEVYTRVVTSMVLLEFESGHTLRVTPEHPMWVQDRGWVEALHLDPGNALINTEGEAVHVRWVEEEYLAEPVAVFNFEVEGAHNYFASLDELLVENGKYCTASIDSAGVVTEEWNETEMMQRFSASDYKLIKQDIQYKSDRANYILGEMQKQNLTVTTDVGGAKVRTASREWVAAEWDPADGAQPKSIRAALAVIRPRPFSQDVDEFLSRVQGGLTILQGWEENQGAISSWVNSTSGAAMGGLARRVPTQTITGYAVTFI